MPLEDTPQSSLQRSSLVRPPRVMDILTVHQVLDHLDKGDPELARLLRMFFFLGMSHREIAEELGMPISTVHRKKNDALKLLRQHFS